MKWRSALTFAALLVWVRPAPAWEANTTHAGLSEQAALASNLHQRLQQQFGFERGLFANLTIPPEDAKSLFAVFKGLNPTHGYVPNGRGKLNAIGWLSAGSVVADSPIDHAANHFFDPETGKGLSGRTLVGVTSAVRRKIVTIALGETLRENGTPAIEWISDADNPMGLDGFRNQYRKAISAATPAERSRHLAGTLLAAGALMHVLQDMGSPSHVRDDLAAHVDAVSPDRADTGSRFERIAALAFGRLGVPAASSTANASTVRALFTAQDGSGLADRTASRWFSAHTLPKTIRIPPRRKKSTLAKRLASAVRRPSPAPSAALDLRAARTTKGASLTDENGTCLARYRIVDEKLHWSLDDECVLDQLRAILPEVVSYSAGLLDLLFRGSIEVSTVGNKLVFTPGGASFGAGTLVVYWDDNRGVRSELARFELTGAAIGKKAALAAMPPKGAKRISALFDGVDGEGRSLLSAGTVIYPLVKNSSK